MMSGNDCWNRNVSSCRRKEETDDADCTSSGRVFQLMKAVTGNERRPAVDKRNCGTCSCSVNDDRRRRRPGRLDTGTSWFRYGGAIPFNTRYAMSASLKLTRSGGRSQCSIASASDMMSQWSHLKLHHSMTSPAPRPLDFNISKSLGENI